MQTTKYSAEFYAEIAAHKTTYKGFGYDSQLEAWWAAFFDLCGWEYTPHPRVPGSRKPDFVIHAIHPIFVEVKPATEIDEEVFVIAREWQCGFDIMMLGNSPDFTKNIVRLGWMSESEQTEKGVLYANPDEVFVNYDTRTSKPGFFHSSGYRIDRISGETGLTLMQPDAVEHLWVLAGRIVRGED